MLITDKTPPRGEFLSNSSARAAFLGAEPQKRKMTITVPVLQINRRRSRIQI